MWAKVLVKDIDEAVQREVEFCTSPVVWDDMRRKGSQYFRWDEDPRRTVEAKSAAAIIEFCQTLPTAPLLSILLERQDGLDWDHTHAGKILLEEIHRRQEKERRALEREQEDFRALQQRTSDLQEREAQVRQHLVQEQQRAAGYSAAGYNGASGWAAAAANAAYHHGPPPPYSRSGRPAHDAGARPLERRRSEGEDERSLRRTSHNERRYSTRDEREWEDGRYSDPDVRGPSRRRRSRLSKDVATFRFFWHRPRR